MQVKFKLYNTLSRIKEEFQPINQGKVGLYACGFTVYDYTHLGHLRKYSMDDVLVRWLRFLDYQVRFVQNVTDVGHLVSDQDEGEDKLEKGAKKYHSSVWDIARQFEEYFFYSMDLIGNLRPDVSCRATEHIKEQIALISQLEKKGYTYIIPGDGVYFDTGKLANYGCLAGGKLNLLAGARVKHNPLKRNITDFALWKFERAGENRAMVWSSPWGERGFPGWHIECSAMSMKYLGAQFDIHTGGIDHITVHHPNEIAQSETATGQSPFVRYWVHYNVLLIDGQKMSKSLGNFFTIDDVMKKNYLPSSLRWLFLTSHYRSEQNFTWQGLMGVDLYYRKFRSSVKEIWNSLSIKSKQKLLTITKSVSLSNLVVADQAVHLLNDFVQSLADDLNTAKAIVVVQNVLKAGLKVEVAIYLLLIFDQVLQLGLRSFLTSSTEQDKELCLKLEDWRHDPQIVNLVEQRGLARQQGNWSQADRLRKQLLKLGYRVSDGLDGCVLEKLNK